MRSRSVIVSTLAAIAAILIFTKRGRAALSNTLVVPGDVMHGSCVYVALKQLHGGGVLLSVRSVMTPGMPHILFAEQTPENIEVLRRLCVLHFRPEGGPRLRRIGWRGVIDVTITSMKALRHKGTWTEEYFEEHMKRMGWIVPPEATV